MRRTLRGFTLIEMAIVMTMLGLVAVGAIKIVGPVRESQKAQITLHNMDYVQKALQLYVIRYGCLPCPANGRLDSSSATSGLSLTDGGAAYGVGVTCSPAGCFGTAPGVPDGVVPWRTIGLSEEEASDGWLHRIRYAVGNLGVNCASVAGGLQSTNGVVACGIAASPPYPTGGISISDNDTGAVQLPDAAYALVSSGPDGSMALKMTSGGSPTADIYGQAALTTGQGLNASNGNSFAFGSKNETKGTAHFDDITRFMTAPNLITRCGAQACGNPT